MDFSVCIQCEACMPPINLTHVDCRSGKSRNDTLFSQLFGTRINSLGKELSLELLKASLKIHPRSELFGTKRY